MDKLKSIFGKKKPLKEILRENKRTITRAVRDIDREKTNLEKQEKKLIGEIKKNAKAGQMGAVKVGTGTSEKKDTYTGVGTSTGTLQASRFQAFFIQKKVQQQRCLQCCCRKVSSYQSSHTYWARKHSQESGTPFSSSSTGSSYGAYVLRAVL